MARAKTIRRTVFGAVSLVLVVGLVAPYINANRFRSRVQQAMQGSLGRKVDIGDVYFNLFNGPGFTLENVTIYEDPAFGLEPLAHVERLNTRVGLSTLWTGRLSFSLLELVEPSVNLVRRTSGGWNLVSLIDRAGEAQRQAGSLAGLPSVEVRSGRLYFKTDDTKSPFYLTDTDVDISPRSGGLDGFDVRFTAQPSRTDRRAQGFATFRGRARFQPRRGAEPVLDIDLGLERSAIEEVVRLVRGHDFGVHGFMSSRARITGPVSNLAVRGQLRIEEVHRWDLMPSGTGWNLNYTGRIDWPHETAAVEIAEAQNPDKPVVIAARLDRYLEQPTWSADVRVNALAADSVVTFARRLGAVLPDALSVTGKLDGGATFVPGAGWRGALSLADSELHLGDAPSLRLVSAPVVLEGESLHFGPAAVTGDDGQSAQMEFAYTPREQAVDLSVRADSLRIAEMQSGSGHLLSAAAVPFVEDLRRGRLNGWLRYKTTSEGDADWTGAFEVHDALATVPGLADPVRIRSASVQLARKRLIVKRLRARTGRVEFLGDYRYDPDTTRPDRFNIVIPQVEAAELERLLMPALRREQGFLARTLRWRAAPPPAWLRSRRAEGSVRIGAITAGDFDMRGVRGALVWDGTTITVTTRDGLLLDGNMRGVLTADLSGAAPRYTFKGAVYNASLTGGQVDLEGAVNSRGTGVEFLLNLQASGTFQARSLTVIPDNPVRAASGEFDLAIDRAGPVLRLTALQASLGTESFSGNAATQGDGTIRLDLASAHRSMRFVGPLVPLRLDPAVAKP